MASFFIFHPVKERLFLRNFRFEGIAFLQKNMFFSLISDLFRSSYKLSFLKAYYKSLEIILFFSALLYFTRAVFLPLSVIEGKFCRINYFYIYHVKQKYFPKSKFFFPLCNAFKIKIFKVIRHIFKTDVFIKTKLHFLSLYELRKKIYV